MIWTVAAVLLQCIYTTELKAESSSRPNIVLIMADDLGYSDLGCYGGEIQTPNLDSLANNGIRFTQFYNTARCWPTRGALLTGYYAQQIRRDTLAGIPSGGRGKRPEWAKLLPMLLKPAGYRSYHTGKWHIDGMPIANGFDRSYYLKDQGRFFNPTRHWLDDKPLPAVAKGTDFYATTALADHAVKTLREHQAKHDGKPFFHYLAFAAPHFPLHALPEDIQLYENRYERGWDVVRSERWKKMRRLGVVQSANVTQLSRVEHHIGPPYHFPEAFNILGKSELNRPMPWQKLSKSQKKFQATKMSIHAAMIHRMDIEIGRVFQQIRDMGQWDNTLVIFLSDNGASAEIMVRDDGHDPSAPMGSAATYLCLGPGWSTTCNTPFRRHKTWTHEGGISTPFIASWPKGIKARGELRRTAGHVIDVVPTILELANAKHDENAPNAPGRSLRQIFEEDSKDPLHESLWWFHDGHKAIRLGDWKAVAPLGEPWELYDFRSDRDESTNLAIPKGKKLAELINEWNRQYDTFFKLATSDLPPKSIRQTEQSRTRSIVLRKRQQDAMPKRRQVLLGGKSFMLNGRHAFLMQPDTSAKSDKGKPWIFYGPTLASYPDKAESWMHGQFLKAGVAVAGIDVGEAYGSPHAFPHFEALYQYMVKNGYSKRPALLGRSRGGLWVSSWALKHPDRVAGIGGIYPVYDYTTYPGVKRAATAYGLTADQLLRNQNSLNPVKKMAVLAKARVPICIIHGTDDKVVPIAANSEKLLAAYKEAKVENLVKLIRAEGQGHSFWPGFFHCQELVDFLIARSQSE